MSAALARSSRSNVNSVSGETDEELHARIRAHLEERSVGGAKGLTVTVNKGTVTLTGVVSSQFERQMLIHSIRRLQGIPKLVDQLRFVAPPAPTRGEKAREFASDLAQAGSDWFASTPKSAWLVIVAAVFIPISMASCGKSETRIAVHPVSGKVSINGESPEGAIVTLAPQGNKLPSSITPSGKVQKDGTYKISVYGEGDGAPAGDYVATVVWFKLLPNGSGAGPNAVPAEYADAKTSPIKVTVKEGANEVPPIEIKAK